jgi:hypothetical protein
MSEDLRAAWIMLEGGAGPALATMRVFRLDRGSDAGPGLLAIDAEGRRHLLLPLPEAGPGQEDTEGLNVQIRISRLLENGRERRFVDVICFAPELAELFTDVCADMLERVEDAPADPAGACVAVLNRWRELLRREVGAALGAQALAALFGELWHLREVVRRDPSRRVDIWAGPRGDRHDLRRDGVSLEVKSSTARVGRPVTIHGHQQLEPPPGGSLYVGWLRLERVPGGGESVPELVAELQELSRGERKFIELLDRAGYRKLDEIRYADVRFAVHEHRVYLVDDSFPRIVSASFSAGAPPAGVLELTYKVELGQEPPVPLDQEETDRLLHRLAGATL